MIVDDVIGFKGDRQLTKLLCLYRNSGLSAIIAGQDLQMLNPTGRCNCNSILLGKLNSAGRVESVVRDFAKTYFPRQLTMDEKIELYQRLTNDHCFLFVDNLNSTMVRVKLNASQVS